MKRILAVLFLTLLAGRTTIAQTATDTTRAPELSKGTIALILDGSLNLHRANFQGLPDVPSCCPTYGDGSGLGGQFGFYYDYDAFGDGHIGVRAAVNSLAGTLTKDEPLTIAVDGNEAIANVEHRIESQFTVGTFEPYYAQDFGKLRLMIGPSIGYIFTKTFKQTETITEPTDRGTFFPENTRVRNRAEGEIPEAESMRFAIVGGVQYPIQLNESGTMHLMPEIFFDYGLTPMVKGLTWSISTFRGGASLGYTPLNTFEPPPPLAPPPPPPPPPPPALAVGIKAYTILDNRRDSTNLSVTVEEFYSTTTTPLLPFVLFGLDDAKIPNRYHMLRPDQTSSFVLRKTDSTDNVRVYHDLLNIVAQRMKSRPASRITLTGCLSNEPEEQADRMLAFNRAKAVAEYLESVWKIPTNRISILTSTAPNGLPPKPSSLTEPDGKEENRRVEIAVTDPDVLAPVTLSDTTLTTNPPMMQFVPSVTAGAGVKYWDLYATTPVMILHHANGDGAQPVAGWTWDLRSSAAKIPRTEDTIEYGLTITDNTGREVTAINTIPVRQTTLSKKRLERIKDKIIERYTLVLFDFGASRIDPANERILDLIREQITPGTKATITGYADRTGDEALNLRLTEDRANAVARMLGAKDFEAKGVGKSKLLFDNNIPEGRFYSRTVNVVLEKPL